MHATLILRGGQTGANEPIAIVALTRIFCGSNTVQLYIYIGLPQIKLCYHYKSHIITILAGVEPLMATRLTVNGQDFSQVSGVTSGCCWIKFPHAAVGVRR